MRLKVLSVAAGVLLGMPVASVFGQVPDSVRARAPRDSQPARFKAFVITTTRAERRVDDTPIRVEVVDEEEVAEKTAMTPGDISMMLNETSGLRVQMTSPSLGGAGVRIQGLRPRYSLILADGLPLYGQAGGLGLLQIPPVDLARAEVIKGSAAALYGPAALGGVINLIARRPGDERGNELLVNQTTRGGSDAVFFGRLPNLRSGLGATLLASGHRQSRRDIDDDGWADLAGYKRGVLRPRLFFDGPGRSIFATAGYTREERDGGTLPGRLTPAGSEYPEGLSTARADVGTTARFTIADRDIIALRASAMRQNHTHQFGSLDERDEHRNYFVEASGAFPRGAFTNVVGAAFQDDTYRNKDVAGFDYQFRDASVFAQSDADVASWLVLSATARVDAHNDYGTSLNPRVSALLRAPVTGRFAGWTARVSGGSGSFAPTPLTEETETVGLSSVRPFVNVGTERAATASVDVGGPVRAPVGDVEVNATMFASRVDHAVQAVVDATTPSFLVLRNATVPTRNYGAEALVRWTYEDARITASYAYTNATEWSGDSGNTRVDVPLTPRHTAGIVASLEKEEESRIGLEIYYTGRQRLEANPYRAASEPYVVVGLLVERWIGKARLFLNAENLGDVRQTRIDPLVLGARGAGGRWTTDVWSLLEGRTINGGVRLSF